MKSVEKCTGAYLIHNDQEIVFFRQGGNSFEFRPKIPVNMTIWALRLQIVPCVDFARDVLRRVD